jgi:hypothetical protein
MKSIVFRLLVFGLMATQLHVEAAPRNRRKASRAKAHATETNSVQVTNAVSAPIDPWQKSTVADAYERIGRRNPKWDAFAEKAIHAYLADNNSEQLEQLIATNAAAAIDAGCDDPLIGYLHARRPLNLRQLSARDRAEAYAAAAEAMDASRYHSYWKYFAAIRASTWNRTAAGTNASPEAERFFSMATNHLAAALKDSSVPSEQFYNAGLDLLRNVRKPECEATWIWFERAYGKRAEPDSTFWLLKGTTYTDLAWQARGSGWAGTVTDAGWNKFGEHLSVAKRALETAWNLNTNDARIPTAMMTVVLGMGTARSVMELWFGRAMAIDPANEQACRNKLYYLEPKWYGSAPDMLAFGRECVSSKMWRGKVPLILVAAHEGLASYLEGEARENYWKRAEVWKDIQTAYTAFFAKNGNDLEQRQHYARYAHRCGQWDEFKKQIVQVQEIDYQIFGGRRAFNQMLREANQNSNTRPLRRPGRRQQNARE